MYTCLFIDLADVCDVWFFGPCILMPSM